MGSEFRQLSAVLGLSCRRLRGEFRLSSGSLETLGAALAFVVFEVAASSWLHGVGTAVAVSADRARSTEFMLAGATLLTIGQAAAVTPRGTAIAGMRFLVTLPIAARTLAFMSLLELFAICVPWTFALWAGAFPESLGTWPGVLVLLLISMLLTVAGAGAGLVLSRAAKVGSFAQLASSWIVASGGTGLLLYGARARHPRSFDLLHPVATWLIERASQGLLLGWLFISLMLALGSVTALYDVLDRNVEQRSSPAGSRTLPLRAGSTDRVLAFREHGFWPAFALCGLLVSFVAGVRFITGAGQAWHSGAGTSVLIWLVLGLVTSSFAAFLASKSAARDLRARAFLQTLPRPPGTSLSSKAWTIRLYLIPSLVVAFAPAMFARGERLQVSAHAAAMCIGIWYAAEAFLAAAFMGSRTARWFSLEALLIVGSVANIALARGVLATLGATAFVIVIARLAFAGASAGLGEVIDRSGYARSRSWSALLLAAFYGLVLQSGRLATSKWLAAPFLMVAADGAILVIVALVASRLAWVWSPFVHRGRALPSVLFAALCGASCAIFMPATASDGQLATALLALIARELVFRGALQRAVRLECPKLGPVAPIACALLAQTAIGAADPTGLVVGLFSGVACELGGGVGASLIFALSWGAAMLLKSSFS
jgi:hypothetical protein